MPIDAQATAHADHRSRWFIGAVYAVQFFFGGWFLAHGLNHWLEFFPRPAGSSPISRELIGALNHSGLFIIVKAVEVVTGALLLANLFVPLAIVAAFPVALSIAHLNLVANHDFTSRVVGVLAIALLAFLAIGYLDKYRSLLRARNDAAHFPAWKHAICIVAGIAAPIALTFWTTSAAGPRSAAHYAAVASIPTTPKEVVQAFDHLAFDERKPKDAVLQFFAPDFIDHSARISGDRQSVINLLDKLDWTKAGPTRTVRHIAADGDIVAMHYHLVREPGTAGFAAVDFFRVKDGKIAEHWEVMQPVVEGGINKHGPF
jgi:predicted SnoaL-like aldol condensation-catalyzing enzyme